MPIRLSPAPNCLALSSLTCTFRTVLSAGSISVVSHLHAAASPTGNLRPSAKNRRGNSDSLTGYYLAGVNPYFEVTHRFPLALGPPMCPDNTFCVKLIAQTRVPLRAVPNLQGTIVSQAVRP